MTGAITGFRPDVEVATPGGPVAIGTLSAGDTVWSWVEATGALRAATVREVLVAIGPSARFLYRLEAAGTLRGCTPGTAVYDSFEDLFRGAGSLSSLATLRRLDGGGTVDVPLEDAVEYEDGGERVVHLTLGGDDATFFADGVLVRHVAAARGGR